MQTAFVPNVNENTNARSEYNLDESLSMAFCFYRGA